MRRNFGCLIVAMALSCAGAAAQQRQRPPAGPARNITSALSRTQPPVPGPAAGAVEGFVYWSADAMAHSPAGSCSGLAITVSVASSSGGPLEAYTPMATLSNNFKYVGQVKSFLAGGRVLVYDVCAYGYDHVPEGVDLHVQLSITQPASFSPVAAPQVAIQGPIKIINAQCNMLPRVMNPTASDLTAHWGSCQNRAYDVNFALVAAAHLMSSGGNSSGGPNGLLSGGVQAEKNPGPNGTPLLRNPGPIGTPLLKAPGPVGIQSLKNPGPVGTVPEKQPGPIGNGALTNAEVMKLVRGGVPEAIVISKIQSAPGNFDFSSSGCRSLAAAHVSRRVLDAMGGGNVRPCFSGGVHAASGADDLNPQPLPPRGTVATAAALQRGRRLASKLRLRTGKKIRILGATAGGISPQVLQALREQAFQAHRQKLALTAAGANPPTRVLAASSALPAMGAGHVLSSGDPAADGSTPGGDPTGGTTPPPGNSSGSNPLQPAGSPSTQIGGSPQTLLQRAEHAPAPMSMCRFTTDPVIENVSGRIHNVVLTPDPGTGQYANNQYMINGCNYGTLQGKVQVFGNFINHPSPVQLGIDTWSDGQILVTFDPTFQDEYDLKNLTLVVIRSDGKNAQLPGVSFYATRVSRSLQRVPHSLVKLPTDYLEQDVLISPVNSENISAANMGLGTISSTASVAFWLYDPIWSSNVGDGYPQTRLSFSDSIDFSQLRPGFVLDPNAQTLLGNYGPDLNSQSWIGVDGGSCKFYDVEVSAALQGSTLKVGVEPAECDNSGKFIYAYYGLALAVIGPKGDLLDPWVDGLQ